MSSYPIWTEVLQEARLAARRLSQAIEVVRQNPSMGILPLYRGTLCKTLDKSWFPPCQNHLLLEIKTSEHGCQCQVARSHNLRLVQRLRSTAGRPRNVFETCFWTRWMRGVRWRISAINDSLFYYDTVSMIYLCIDHVVSFYIIQVYCLKQITCIGK